MQDHGFPEGFEPSGSGFRRSGMGRASRPRLGRGLVRRSGLFPVAVGAVGVLLAAELIGAVALGGFPAEVEVKASPTAITQVQGQPIETVKIHFRNFDDEQKTPLYFHVDRQRADGATERAHLVGATGACFANGDTAAVNLFTWVPFGSRDCTVSYVADGGSAKATLKFDHKSGLPVAPIWFGNRTTYQEPAVG